MRTFSGEQIRPRQSAALSTVIPLSRAAVGKPAIQRQAAPATAERGGHDFGRIAVSSGDAFEREADRISERVVGMPEPRGLQGPGRLPTQHVGPGDLGAAAAPPIVHEVLRSPGEPLGAAVRGFMEPRFGHDFSQVKVHTDGRAAQSADAIDALAYTAGRHVVFGGGQASPGTAQGRRLLAHELAHVVQQGNAATIIQRAPKKPAEPAPRLPTPVIHGSTAPSRAVQAYRIDHRDVPASTNLLAVEYSVGTSPKTIKVIENRGGVAHSEAEMDAFIQQVRRQTRSEVTVHEIYSERQPCGPSDHDCEGLLIKRYPRAKTTFGEDYQETQTPGPVTRASRARVNIKAAHDRLVESRQLEWDFKGKTPPSHYERLEPGSPSTRPRRSSRSRRGFFRKGAGAVGSEPGAEVVVDFLIQKYVLDPKSNAFLEKEMKAAEPLIEQHLELQDSRVLSLQQRGEIAYANVTFLLESVSAKSRGGSSLARVELQKVEVTDWFKQGTEHARKGSISFSEVVSTTAGLSGELMTYSEAMGLHPDLVDRALGKLEGRLAFIEAELEKLVLSDDYTEKLLEEYETLTACHTKLMSGEGVYSIGFLAGACTDLIKGGG